MNGTTLIGFHDKLNSTVALVEGLKGLVITTAPQYLTAKDKLETIRTLEKELEAEYKEHPTIIEAKKLQGIKGDIAKMLEDARKGLKNGPMLVYEKAEEAKLRAEEERIAAELKKKADAEAAAAAEIKRKEAEAARKEAERAKKRGDEEAAAAARQRQEEAKAEQERIKTEAAQAVVPVVVLEKTTPTVSRRMIRKFRMKNPAEVKRDYLMPDEKKIGAIVRALGKAAEQTVGGIEVYEEPA